MRVMMIAAMAATLSTPAFAQDSCAPWQSVVDGLADNWGESIVGYGLATGGDGLFIFASPETGTWTAVILRPDGAACQVMAGEGW